jgi:hypothetical protein
MTTGADGEVQRRPGRPAYPFEPRSNAHLEAGQFWGIPLSDGRFACGRVLAVPRVPDPAYPVNARTFLAGLLDWVGDAPPTQETIAGARIRDQGFAHVKSIRENGGLVLGHRPLGLDAIEPAPWRSHPIDGVVWVYAGATRLRPAGTLDAGLPVITGWGFKLIERLAEGAFVGRP